jgi:hypothetical protein
MLVFVVGRKIDTKKRDILDSRFHRVRHHVVVGKLKYGAILSDQLPNPKIDAMLDVRMRPVHYNRAVIPVQPRRVVFLVNLENAINAREDFRHARRRPYLPFEII